MKKIFAIMLVLSMLVPACAVADGVFSPNEQYEYLVGAVVWQMSGESQAMMMQAFSAAKGRISEMYLKCLSADEPDWALDDGKMLFKGERVAVITDIDDTLVDGVHYTANIVGKDGDYSNAAFARFVMSDACTALPGAVDFIEHCLNCGAEVFYITNRYDQGYKIGQSDSFGGYPENGGGLYFAKDGTEIGTTTYQVFGQSFYDITLASMEKLGFPIDENHLIVNDSKLNGESKEAARNAVINGAADYPTGQRADGNATGTALTATYEKHCAALLLGDQLGDFTADFAGDDLDAVSRAALTEKYADKWGTEWILLPNAVYGSAYSYALKYGISQLFEKFDYVFWK